MDINDIKKVIKYSTQKVIGCTEPVALALSGAVAASVIKGKIPSWLDKSSIVKVSKDKISGDGDKCIEPFVVESVHIRMDRALYKNSLAVGIPNTGGEVGVELAAAMGPFLDSEKGMSLLKQSDSSSINEARRIIKEQRVSVEIIPDERFYIETRLIGLCGQQRHVAEVTITDFHSNISMIKRNGTILYKKKHSVQSDRSNEEIEDILYNLSKLKTEQIVELIEKIDKETKDFVLEGIDINLKAAQIGLEKGLGLAVGKSIQDSIKKGIIKEDICRQIQLYTAAAADARMSGYEIEVMSSSGSGNQGIMVTVPIGILGRHMNISDDRLAIAATFAHIITAIITFQSGVLTALCGCVVKAGIGATSGMAYLLEVPIDKAVKNMAGNVTGTICDGAKVGCALKLATAAYAACDSTIFAKNGIEIPSSNGIMEKDVKNLFNNIGLIAKSMKAIDRTIVEIMERKR